MKLTPEDAKLFYDLMWKLQLYVNQKNGFHKNITSFEEYANLPTEEKLKERDALWEHPKWIDAYVKENPDSLPPEELGIIQKWKHFVKGTFFLLRHLKKGSIFIGGEGDLVYSVQGIQDDMEEVLPSYALPQMVLAILLPFKGQIIYDGLLQGYNLLIGGGIRSNLNHTYTVAKQKDRIITTLDPELEAPKNIKPKYRALPQLKEINTAMGKIKGDGPLQTSALNLARLCLRLSITDAEGKFAPDEIESQAQKIVKASRRLLNLLDIMEEE